MKKILVLMVCLSVLAFCGPAQAGWVPSGTVDFEDLYPGYEAQDITIPDGYGGFNWSPDFLGITKYRYPGSGYEYGCIGKVCAYTGWADDVWFAGPNGDDFNFIGAFITAAWDETEDVIVNGYQNGALVRTTTITTNNDELNFFSFNWLYVDKVEFQPQGQHLAIDNISHCHGVVPIPAAVWLLGAGLMGLVGLRKKVRS
jgi:hypothetical protein